MDFYFFRPSFLKKALISLLLISSLISCKESKSKKQARLYNTQCASCHIAPSIDALPKEIWANNILPDMGARMGIQEPGYNPMAGLSYSEMEIINKTGIYPLRPRISQDDWKILKEYIIAKAPDSLGTNDIDVSSNQLTQFKPTPISLDSTPGTFLTFLKYDALNNNLLHGDISGKLFQYDFIENKNSLLYQMNSAVVDFTGKDSISYLTAIGKLDPSEFHSGRIFGLKGKKVEALSDMLHRPVNSLVDDLNNDGVDEIVVSEFGNLTGQLSLLKKGENSIYEKSLLLNLPGTIKVVSKDMNKDGKKDLVALTSQGDESISILYQEDNLNFSVEKVIRFSPIYGSSWFELLDYDGDGDDDIITVNGDNADKSYVHKPYHGLRIHINDGKNQFQEKYFYPLNGATRLLARDFDADGDIDFGVLSTFPDYQNKPEFSFVYLENINASNFSFESFTFKDANLGRWFLMDAGDVDQDGDLDIILSSFTYVFTPVPETLSQLWNEKNVDLMVLENTLKNK